MNNPKNWYTHYDIITARFLQKYLLPDTKINFLGEAYIYENEDLIYSNELFNKWYEIVLQMKNNTNKNSIVKSLTSRCWGDLCKNNYKIVNEIEYDKNKV
jgi:hypothetical protein